VGDRVDEFIAGASLWPAEMAALRVVLLRAGLSEELKWGKPCFSADGTNIVIMQPMKNFLSLMFFAGAFLSDPHGVLEEQGPNSRSARRVCLRSVADVKRLTPAIRELLAAALVVELQGRPALATPPLELVAELQARIDADPTLRRAFEGLTPGRQREYNLHISGAKQVATRESRITKCTEQILAGKGLRDR
jgi:uncharacterized protein YdeI (YjbR/CyaY-like superfamily)